MLQFRALGFSGQAKLTPSMARRSTLHCNPTDNCVQRRSGVLLVGRKMKTEIPLNRIEQDTIGGIARL